VKTQSRSVGEINRAVDRDARREDRAQRRKTARAKASRPFKIAIVLAVIVAALWISYIVVSQTLAFAITDVQVEGAEHLTEQEALALADIADDATLLNVDTAAIATSFKRDAWVADIKVKKQFPSTLKIVVTERQMQAVVEVPVGATQAIQDWAISADGIWLMAIPAQDSEIGKQLSAKIYEDAASMLLITGVPYGVSPAIGAKCTDSNILNALEIVAGMTTDLSNRVKKVTATDAESTLLTLDDNVEIAFGTADDIREKERIVEEIMSSVENVVYINVRVPERPTWRAA
jgi:cell division protein FtsQ